MKDEFEGSRTLHGQLKKTKGNQMVVEGVILVFDDPLRGEEMWRDLGKDVELRGDFYTHHCDPEEQCPEEGYIQYLRNVVRLDR